MEGYAEARVILGNWELTLASEFLQLNTVRPGRCGPSGLSRCILYHFPCDLGILMNLQI